MGSVFSTKLGAVLKKNKPDDQWQVPVYLLRLVGVGWPIGGGWPEIRRCKPLSQHTYFQAFPKECSLFQRLRHDRPFHVLYSHLTLLGLGPFFLSQINPAEVEDLLNWFARNEPGIASLAEAQRLLAEVNLEVEQARATYPGIEHRAAFLEQVQEEMATALVGELQQSRVPLAAPLLDNLMYGQDVLTQGLFCFSELQFFLVPTETVTKGAQVLLPITPNMLAQPGVESAWFFEDFERWRQVYLEAAKRGEIILVLNA